MEENILRRRNHHESRAEESNIEPEPKAEISSFQRYKTFLKRIVLHSILSMSIGLKNIISWIFKNDIKKDILITTLILAIINRYYEISIYSLVTGGELLIHRSRICDNDECRVTAMFFKHGIDDYTDPCSNFYKYSCGKFQYSSYYTFNRQLVADLSPLLEQDMSNEFYSQKQAKIFYRSCKNISTSQEINIEKLKILLNKLNLPNIPISSPKKSNDKSPFGKFIKNLNLNIFFVFNIIHDLRFSEVVIKLNPPPRIIFDHKVNSSLDHTVEIMKSILKRYFPDYTGQGSEFSEGIMLPLLLDINMALCIKKRNRNSGVEMSLTKFQNIMDEYVLKHKRAPKFNLIKIFNLYFKSVRNTDIKNFTLFVTDPDYFLGIALLFSHTDERTIESLMWWKFVEYYFAYANHSSMLAESNDILEPVSANCAIQTSKYFRKVLFRLYINSTSHRSSTYRDVSELVTFIKMSFRGQIDNCSWLNESDKMKLFKKIETMKLIIGYPESILNDTHDIYADIYEKLHLSEDDFFGNIMQINSIYVYRDQLESIYRKLNASLPKIDDIEWEMADILRTIPYYHFNHNCITLPAPFIHEPFYYLGQESMNYGALGWIIAHEISHGIDDELRSSLGNNKSLESSAYETRIKCYVDQYDKFDTTIGNVDGTLTLTENIADNMGLKAAYNAYRMWLQKYGKEQILGDFLNLSSDQLFFLSFAHGSCSNLEYETIDDTAKGDRYAPQRFRVLGALQNSKEFSKAWNCPIGSPMNPERKCVIW